MIKNIHLRVVASSQSSQDIWYNWVREKEKGRKECMPKVVGFVCVSFLANQLNENSKIKYAGVRSMTLSLESKL